MSPFDAWLIWLAITIFIHVALGGRDAAEIAARSYDAAAALAIFWILSGGKP